ncbi:MAG: hypothetical protein MHM6MM_004390 [Cercozoa sp. M6MM]
MSGHLLVPLGVLLALFMALVAIHVSAEPPLQPRLPIALFDKCYNQTCKSGDPVNMHISVELPNYSGGPYVETCEGTKFCKPEFCNALDPCFTVVQTGSVDVPRNLTDDSSNRVEITFYDATIGDRCYSLVTCTNVRGEKSPEVNFTHPVEWVPGAPDVLWATSMIPGTLDFAWNLPFDDGGGLIKFFEVAYRMERKWFYGKVPMPQLHYRATNIDKDSPIPVEFRVRAITNHFTGPYSNITLAIPYQRPAYVYDLTAKPSIMDYKEANSINYVMPYYIDFTWDADDEVIDKYEVINFVFTAPNGTYITTRSATSERRVLRLFRAPRVNFSTVAAFLSHANYFYNGTMSPSIQLGSMPRLLPLSNEPVDLQPNKYPGYRMQEHLWDGWLWAVYGVLLLVFLVFPCSSLVSRRIMRLDRPFRHNRPRLWFSDDDPYQRLRERDALALRQLRLRRRVRARCE